MTKNKISSDWEHDAEGNLTCMHWTDLPDLSIREDRGMILRHILLEVLAELKVIEYTRGYDGHYYDITIKK